MKVRNIIFDIGNVLLKWHPVDIVTKNFSNDYDFELLASKIFESNIWRDLNLGKITEKEAIKLYSNFLENVPVQQITDLMGSIKESLTPVEGSIELLNNVYNLGIPLYSITDNVKEIMTFIKQKYSFFEKFIDIIVSADVGIVKPSQAIYLHLINKHKLIPEETVFIDDLYKNIEGAKSVGMQGIHFINALDCQNKLMQLGFKL